MWVFTKDGFYSAVHKNCQEDEVLVRTRSLDDLLKLCKVLKKSPKVLEIPYSDYAYRMVFAKSEWVDYLTKVTNNLDYDNFKNASCSTDDDRHDAYYGAWQSLYSWQERLKKKCNSATRSQSHIHRQTNLVSQKRSKTQS